MRSIARRSSSTAATKSSRDPALCVSATNARRAFLGEVNFEKSGVALKAAFRGSTLIRFVSFFHSSRRKYSRSASLRAAASSISLGNTNTSSDGSSECSTLPSRSALSSFSDRKTVPLRPDFLHCSRR
jgi:hypothetical protein